MPSAPTIRRALGERVDYVRLRILRVIVAESDREPATQRLYDCGLTPDQFQFDAVRPGSVIEVYEGGVPRSCWEGAWTAA